MTAVHATAATGFEAGADAYARGRPDYPAALDRWLRDKLQLGSRKAVLDLGAGTGKFTPRLLATGASVIAVEPVAAMRAKLSASYPNVSALDGTAEAIPLPNASLDAVVCAQAFHWFATAAALAEIRRVLKPDGALALIWNVRDKSVDWVRATDDILAPYEGDAPRYHTGKWRAVFPAEGFGPLVETQFPHAHTGTSEDVIVDRQLSVSFIAALPAEERQKVAADMRALIARTPELAGKAEVTFPYVTSVFVSRKL